MDQGEKKKAPITNYTNERGDITTEPPDIGRITRRHHKQVMPINLTTSMQWVSSLKTIHYQKGLEKK